MAARLGWALVWISQGWDVEITSTSPRVLLWGAKPCVGTELGCDVSTELGT